MVCRPHCFGALAVCHGGDLWQRKLPPNGTDVKERVTSGLRSYSLAHGPIPSDRDMLSGPALKGSTMS